MEEHRITNLRLDPELYNRVVKYFDALTPRPYLNTTLRQLIEWGLLIALMEPAEREEFLKRHA